MTLTCSQFHFVKENYGSMGLFAVIVCWEHIMLFIKYLMHSLVSPYPVSVTNAIKKEEYTNHSKRNKERNRRKSNIHGIRSIRRTFTEEEKYSKYSNRTNSSRNIIAENKENLPLLVVSSDKGKEVATISPCSKNNMGIQQLRQRKGSCVKSAKQSRTKQNSPCHTLTPKRDSTNKSNNFHSLESKERNSVSARKAKTTKNVYSPFGVYFHDNEECTSPMINTDFQVDDESISDLLSVSGGLHYDDDSYNCNDKLPSMSRARLERKSVEEKRAAQERIKQRISGVGERRKKLDRHMI